MRLGGFSSAILLCLAWGTQVVGQTGSSSARVETAPLRLIDPDPYQVTSYLEPVRRVKIVAPIDGMIRSLNAQLGGTVRESDDLVQFDPTEANARLRMAEAEVKEKQALKRNGGQPDIYAAQVEAAEARVELARAQLNRCAIRAPFSARVVEVAVSPAQYVLKGTTIVELVDTSSLRAILPVDRRSVAVGSTITVPVEEQEVTGKVQAILPLPDGFLVLRELATPFAGASVILPNTKGQLDAGLRARPAGVPLTPIANVAKRALRSDDVRGPSSSMVQVIRNEYVTNVPVHVLGGLGPDRIQVSGLFRNGDVLVVGSSVPLIPGTLVRFHDSAASRGIEPTSPNPAHGGAEAGITPPGGNVSTANGRGTNTYSGAGRRPATPPSRPGNSQAQAGNAPPF
jgi:multidrug efflux pump subunit AcrA (membrane-fusion protein)